VAFDVVFLDAWKRNYQAFFDLVLTRLKPRGLFMAHNVVNQQTEMRDVLATIQNSPARFPTIVIPSGDGMSFSYKLP
jgi:predicted O-methyltransferase YrrM